MQPASATRDDATLAIGSDELAEGLMLVRASTLKIIRLQLAMERRDRRVAIEAVDDLVALDRSLEEFLTQIPAGNDDGLFRNLLELERSALNIEKHTLAAGISSRNWPESDTVGGAAEPEEWAAYEEEKEDEATPQRWLRFAVMLVAILLSAGIAYFLGADGIVPDLIRGIR